MNRILTGVGYLTSILIVSTIWYLVMQPLFSLPAPFVTIDALLVGVLLVGLLILLKNVVKYSNLPSLAIYPRTAVYGALAILFVVCWNGIGLLVLHIVYSPEECFLLLPSIPLRILIGILVYCTAIQWYLLLSKKEQEIPEEDYCLDKNEEDSSVLPINEEPALIENNILDRIAVKNGQRIDVVPISEIIYLQADGDYVMIYSHKGRFMKEQTMKSFENILPPNQFVRVHRSSIVNVDFISQIELYDKQSQLLKMQNGAQIRVSASGYKVLKKTLQLK